MTLRVVFMGTPDFSVPALSEIIANGHDVVAVYSQPPRPAGRGMSEKKSPVHALADDYQIPVLTPTSLRSEDVQAVFHEHNADVAVVVAYGLLLPSAVLDAPKFGCLNLHASQLPRWRGAAPIQRAIMAGDKQTAMMVMQMDEGLDTGPICLSETVMIGPNMTAGELHDALSGLGGDLIVRALAALERGSLATTVQPTDGVTYADKIKKSEARIDFNQTADQVHNLVRGLSPFPGAWFEMVGKAGKLERIKIVGCELSAEFAGQAHTTSGVAVSDRLDIACREGAVRLTKLQRAGKKPVTAEEFLRGFPVKCGDELVGRTVG